MGKTMLEGIVAKVSEATGSNLWRKTATVIDWFVDIPDKSRSSFIKFDICDFYPSISEDLLDKAIEFAQMHTYLSSKKICVIKHARKSLLFSRGEEWVKKNATDDLFDVTMGSYDGAEVCELVGLYLLSKLQALLGPKSVGLYRDDGLAYVRSLSGRRLDKLRKDITAMFKAENLSITMEISIQITDFLDATFNLITGKYAPFRKPNTKPLYINSKSNHPPMIMKELPGMINRRLSDLSSDADEFNSAKGAYEEALHTSDHASNLEYAEPVVQRQRRRNRKVIWFNPPYSSNVKNSIGKTFLRLLNKHFPRTHPYAKILNRNTIKISYSCMPNMKSIISQQNSHLLHESDEPDEQSDRTCCRQVTECPFNGACLTEGIVYNATVTVANSEHVYHGLTKGTAKDRYDGHMTSFRHEKYENETELSKFVWSLQRKGLAFSIKWGITQKAHSYRCGSKKCDLCLAEKVVIERCKHPRMLNKRTELISKCRHKNRFILANLKSKV